MKKKTKDRVLYLGFDDRLLAAIGIPVLAFLVLAIFCQFRFSELGNSFLANFIEACLYTSFYWYVLLKMVVYYRKRFPEFKDSKKRITYQIIFMLIFTPLSGGLLNFIITWLQDLLLLPLTHKPSGAIATFATYLVSFMMVAVYEAIYFYHQLSRTIVEQERAKQEHILSQLEGLRNQVNPHFLFNSMNTLMNIVQEDQKLARRFLEKLSKVYRYILESRDEKLIPLERELEFINAYVFLQKERFRGNLTVEIDIPEDRLQDFILPLSIQILFENIIKHNIISTKQPLNVWVYLDEHNKLVVKNTFQPKNHVLHSTKVGLQNIRTRYQFYTTESVDVKEDEEFFCVSIPILTNQAVL